MKRTFEYIDSLSTIIDQAKTTAKVAPLLLLRAVAYASIQNFDNAIDDLSICLQIDSTSSLAYWQRAVSSLFNSVSTLFTVDVYQKLKPDTPQRQLVTIGRITTVCMTALGLIWVPIMKAIAGGGLYQYIQSVQSFLAPPIVAVFLLGLCWKRMNLRGAVWGLSVGFVLGMAKLGANAIWGGADGFAFIQDFYFSGILLALSVGIVVVASLSAPAPEPKLLNGLTFACLDEKFRQENRASWNKWDVIASCVVVGLVVAAYAYFWTWLG